MRIIFILTFCFFFSCQDIEIEENDFISEDSAINVSSVVCIVSGAAGKTVLVDQHGSHGNLFVLGNKNVEYTPSSSSFSGIDNSGVIEMNTGTCSSIEYYSVSVDYTSPESPVCSLTYSGGALC